MKINSLEGRDAIVYL